MESVQEYWSNGSLGVNEFLNLINGSLPTELKDNNNMTAIRTYPVFMSLVGVNSVTIVASLGCVLNILSIIVLFQPRMRSTSMNILLIGLQISDLIVVFVILWVFGLPKLLFAKFQRTRAYIFLIGLTAKLGSHYFTILVCFERYIAVCHPLRAKVVCSPNRAVTASTLVTTFSTLVAVPYALGLLSKEVAASVEFILVYAIPVVIIVYLNTRIYIGYRRSQKTHRWLGCNQNADENSLTFMLMAIVVVFLICGSSKVVYNLYYVLGMPLNDPIFTLILQPIVALCMTINSASNFIFYCAFGTKFRSELRRVLKCNSGYDANTVSLQSTSSTSRRLSETIRSF